MKKVKNQVIPRRLKIVPVSEHYFDQMYRTDYEQKYKVVSGLPKDSHMVGIRHDLVSGVVHLLYESSEFDVVKEGDIPPVLDVVLQDLPQD